MASLFAKLAFIFLLLLYFGGMLIFDESPKVAQLSGHPELWPAYMLALVVTGALAALTYWLMRTCWSDAKIKHPNLMSRSKPPPV